MPRKINRPGRRVYADKDHTIACDFTYQITQALLEDWKANVDQKGDVYAILSRAETRVATVGEEEVLTMMESAQEQIKRRFEERESAVAYQNWLHEYEFHATRDFEKEIKLPPLRFSTVTGTLTTTPKKSTTTADQSSTKKAPKKNNSKKNNSKKKGSNKKPSTPKPEENTPEAEVTENATETVVTAS